MSVQELLDGYIAEHRAGGEADPVAYLRRAEPGERKELAALIDAYLERSPRIPFDETAYASSGAPATVEALERSISGASGTWPAVLPRLRARAGLMRRELVERLAAALGQKGREEKVGLYYHEMEQGLLPSEGVSDRVLEALARLTGTTLATLREAGQRLLGEGGERTGPEIAAFARASLEDAKFAPDFDVAVASDAEMADMSSVPPETWDEVDELFRGREV